MNLLAAANYDPVGGAVSKVTTSLLAMTALDTTNLRIAFTIPSHGMVHVRMQSVHHGSTTTAQLFLGALEGATLRGRQNPTPNLLGTAIATTRTKLEVAYTITGLTPGAVSWDAAYGVEIVSSAGGAIKYGGANDTTTDNAYGGFNFEIWDPRPLPTAAPAAVGGVLTSPTTANVGLADLARILGTVVATPATAGVLDTNVKNMNNVAATPITTIKAVQGLATDGVIPTATNVTTVNGLAANVITAASINADAITAAKIADGAIDAATFAAGAINAAAIATDAITAAKIAADAIGASELAADAVTEIQAGLATPTNITAGTITTVTNRVTANTDQWAGGTIPAPAVTGVPKIDLVYILGTILTETAGQISAAFKQFFNVASPTGTMKQITLVDTVTTLTGNTVQTGDSFTRLGAPAGVSVSADIAAIESQTDDIGAAGAGLTAIPTIATVTTLTNLPAITANWLTAAGIAAGALNGKGDWNIGKTGYDLSVAGVQAIWDALTSALTTVGSIGKLIVDNLNATISSRASQTSLDAVDDFVDTEVAAIKTKTDQLTFTVANQVDANSLSGIPSAATIADAVLDEDMTAHQTQGSLGQAIGDPVADVDTIWGLANINLDATISSRTKPSDTQAAVTLVTTTTTLTNLPAITANWLTAAGINAGALNGKGDWNIGKTGYALSVAAIQAIWDALTSALTTVGSIGKLIVDNLDATISSRSSHSVTDIWASVIETGYTVTQSMRLMLAALAGKLSGAATTTVTIRDVNDTKNRIVATVDADGNRTAVTKDVS